MKEEDLEQFAVADGLLARIAARPGRMSHAERTYLLDQAARTLARVGDLTVEEAERTLYPFTSENPTTIQCGEQFACVSAWGRLLYVIARSELRGICHPDAN
jgi:hypothetical protein